MTIDWFKNRRVTLMGLGFHGGGVGMVEWLCEIGAEVTVTDFGDENKLHDSLNTIRELPVRLILGRHDERDFIDTDCVIRNPAIPAESPYLKLAKEHHVPIEMESSLFFRFCPTRNIIAVTGTKGKSSTVQMIAHVLSHTGLEVVTAGNMGVSMVKALSSLHSSQWVVLELSSFQCEGFAGHIEEFRADVLGPKYALLTNLFEDHLNRYANMQSYALAKKLLFESQAADQKSFMLPDGKWEQFVKSGLVSSVVEASVTDVENIDGLMYPHLGNLALVRALTVEMDIPEESFRSAMSSFRTLEHRLETVRKIGNVEFINDSTATNPTAGAEDIKLLLKQGRKLVLIIGGNDKEMDYSNFIEVIKDNKIPYVLLEGTADKKLAELPVEFFLGRFDSLEAAIEKAYNTALLSDSVVALIPGATSFNMFRDEFDRGNIFKQIVMNL